MKTIFFKQKEEINGKKMGSLCNIVADPVYHAFNRCAALLKAKFSIFGLMVFLAITFSSCQKNNDIMVEGEANLLAIFDDNLTQFKNDYYNSEVPYTKSGDYDYSGSQGTELPLEVKNYLNEVISTSGSCENIDELIEHMCLGISDMNTLNFEDNVNVGLVNALSLYVVSIDIALSNTIITKTHITPSERELIRRAAENDHIAAILWAYVTGFAAGGVYGASAAVLAAMVWEYLM
jgi:hypothetical protein